VRIHVDQDACTGHALCAALGPDVYVLDEEGFNRTPDQEIDAARAEQARRGALACPEQAITVGDDAADA
jgi:ferredoxin